MYVINKMSSQLQVVSFSLVLLTNDLQNDVNMASLIGFKSLGLVSYREIMEILSKVTTTDKIVEKNYRFLVK